MKTKKIIIGELLVLFLLTMVLVLTNNISTIDETIYQGVIYVRSNLFDFIFKTITKAGNVIPVLCIVVVSLLCFKNKKDQNMLGVAVVSTVLTNQLLKRIIRRARPSHVRLIEEKGFSFPSGHAMISIALYGFLIYYVYKHVKNKYVKVILMTLLLLLIIVIGFSRIYLGVHYPSDVIGGYSLALTILIVVIDWFENHNRGNKND